MGYTDQDIPIECAECVEPIFVEGVLPMVEHILSMHPYYSPEEAANFARLWADDAYEQSELENIERAEYFRRHGHDIEDVDRDD